MSNVFLLPVAILCAGSFVIVLKFRSVMANFEQKKSKSKIF